VFADGHFQLPIPWKAGVVIPDNKQMAISRLRNLRANLLKRGLFEAYGAEIEKLLQKGYAEVAPDHQLFSSETWYLPHHLVLNPKKPGKLRVVFDCAARFQNESLNDKCHSGPDLLNRLFNVLLRFREHKFAFGGDVAAMYMQVVIPPEQRDALRFLWFSSKGEIVAFRMTRHLFGGVWCSSSSTYALRKCLFLNPDDPPSPDVQSVILNSFYVDDCLHSAESEEQLVVDALGTRDALLRGGFRLTKFVSNATDLLTRLPSDECVSEGRDFSHDPKVLGIRWNVDADEFYFQIDFEIDRDRTKRDALRILSSIYDPLGLLAPFVLPGKLILQEAVRLKLAWTDILPDPLLKSWKDWLHCLTVVVQDFRVPRCIKPCLSNYCVCELHAFSDASERALGCCVFLRCIDRFGFIQVSLVCSKGRLAPIKSMSIPRLELDAAVMSVKVHNTLSEELRTALCPTYFWTDSEIVLKYIFNESKRFMTFVANRISIIRSATDLNQWHHIPGKLNVADFVTRGLYAVDKRWMCGPDFLQRPRSEWKLEAKVNADLEDDVELKKAATALATAAEIVEHPIDTLTRHHSTWIGLKKAVAALRRVWASWKKERSLTGCFTPAELRDAEVCVINHVQSKHYKGDVERLSNSKSLSPSSSIARLDPFIDEDGLLRVGGRLRHTPAQGFCLHPVIVSHKHRVAELIARHYHNIAHLGTEWVVSHIREKFWLTHIRSIVRKVRYDCRICRRLFGAPLEQKMADLPAFRTNPGDPPFSVVGIDCFGNFTVKRGRSNVKRYGCIFCCLATRAVHLEVLDSMDTSSLLNALRRFMARRGTPKKIVTDNGTNFVGGRREMFSLRNDVEWVFQTPHASHMSGAWERLIRTVRKVLAGMMPCRINLSDDALQTLFCEVERMVNSRPITKVSEDVSDGSALTPNHLLMMNHCPAFSPGSFVEADIYRQRWRCIQHLADVFWRKWVLEYLPELQKRSKWLSEKRCLSVGDVVLVSEENTPRGVWPMGLVIEVKKSADMRVRSCKLRLKNGSELWRPVTKCIFLKGAIKKFFFCLFLSLMLLRL
jgi:transposase InsO family protein